VREVEVIAQTLAEFAHGLTADAIPAAVRSRACHLILDAVGIGFASTRYEFARKTLDALSAFGAGSGYVIGCSRGLPLRDAAMMNGILIHGLDYDDTHLTGVVHASASCFPTALAVASELGRSGEELLTAYIIGIEAAARLGAVAKGELNQIGFHPTGVIAAFACALIAGKLHGLDARQLTMAQGIALSMAAGTREYSTEGAWTKRMHPGWAAACGITAAVLARGGFIGPTAAYEGRFGLYATHVGGHSIDLDMAAATRGLGETWETLEVAIKPLPACQLSIACIDAAIALGRSDEVRLSDIARIEALVPPHAVKIVCEPAEAKRRPSSSYAAQFSVQFGVAAGLLRQRFGLNEIEDIRDPQILALADKVDYRVDPHTGYPKHFSGEVIVTFADGRKLSHREQINRGASDNPVGDSGIIEKFMDNARIALTQSEAEHVCASILALDGCAQASSIGEALARGPLG